MLGAERPPVSPCSTPSSCASRAGSSPSRVRGAGWPLRLALVDTRAPPKALHSSITGGWALIRTAISERFGEEVYATEIDDGEDVLVKANGSTPDFDLVLVRNTAEGLEIDLERE